MRTFRARPAAAQVHVLGEGPFWDAPRERLIWIDVNGERIHTGQLTGDEQDQVEPQTVITMGETVGAAVCSADGDLLVAGARSLSIVRADGSRTAGPQLIPDGKNSRLNDGGCDPAGRFLVGSLALDDREGEEQLVRIDRWRRGTTDGGDPQPASTNDPAITVIDDDLTLSNGLAWSPDGTRFYSTDTTPKLIYARSYDTETGSCGTRTPFLEITGGSPDGMCADRDGNLWVAIWGAGEVRCYSPAGVQLATVEVAAPNPSSVAFAGPALDVLVITTASEQLSADQLARFPGSGKLFTCRVSITGLPVPVWVP